MDKNEEEKKNLIEEKTEDGMIGIQPSKLKVFNIFELIFAYISLFVLNNPKMSCFLMVLNLIAVVMIINANVRNAPDISRIIEHDYSGVSSKYDLHLGTIDHWCLGGGDGNCHCEDPLSPSKKKSQIWSKAVDENWFDIKTALRFWGEEKGSIDVVFLGANIVEYWKGRTIGRTTSAFAEEVAGKFKKIFEKGKIKALPLGIAGDTVSNVLWRLQNGELPDTLQPKIWWLVIGDNDMAIKQCSEEVVLMGILRIVEEILDKIPDARIVINSILPMTSNENGFTPNVKFRNVKKLSKQLIEGDADVESEANTRRRLKGDDEDEDNFKSNNNNASNKSSLSGLLESKTSLSSEFNNTTTSSSSKQQSLDKSSSSPMLAENTTTVTTTNPGSKNAHAKPIEGNTTTYASTSTVNSNDTEKDLSTITITTNKTIITDNKIAIKSATTNDNNKTVTKSKKEDNNSNDNTKQTKKSIPTLILPKHTTNGDVDDERETDSEDIKQEEEKKKEWKTDDDDNGDGDDKPENDGDDERQDKEKNKEEKKKEWKVWTPTEKQKKKWELKWGNNKNKKAEKNNSTKAEKDSDNDSEKPKKKWRGKKDDEKETLDDEIANGGNNNNKKARKDSDKDSEKPKKIWKWSGKKDDKKMDDKIGNESQLTSASGEMKPAKGSESVSLWHSVVAINVALSKFCWTNKQVTFFDANDIFIEDRKLITDLILSPNSGQPSVAGHGELLLAIEQKVKDILHADAKKERKIYRKSSVRSKEEDDDEY